MSTPTADEKATGGSKSSLDHSTTDHNEDSLMETLDPKVEAKLRMKIDLMIVPTVSLLYLFCFIDRANIGNARLAGLEKELHLTGYDYNTILSVFYISYVLFEIPSNILCKKVGPGWFIPTLTLLFGITSIGTGYAKTKAQIAGIRFLLGLFEAGMLPGVAYYMSRWYKRSELTFRLGIYIVFAPLAGAFGGLLASGILKLSHFGGVRQWRMIFVIEGIITISLAVVGFFTLTDRPETARWLSEEEKRIAISRVNSERLGHTELIDKMDTTKIVRGLFNPTTLSTSFIFLLNNVTVQGLAFFLPTIVKTIYPTKSGIFQQLRTVPPYVVGAFFTLLFPYLSWKMDRRQIFFIICAPLMMIGYIMFLASHNQSVRYGATFLIASGAFSFGPLTNAQVAANVVSDTARASAIGMNVMFGNIGGLIATWSFLPFDGPDYKIGNGLNLATSSTIFVLSIIVNLWMVRDNAKRDAAQSGEPIDPNTTEELDYKHPSFRWKP